MSVLGAFALAQAGQVSAEVSTEDQIRNAATMISITLAVLSAFTTQRATSAKAQDGTLERFREDELKRDLALDVALATFGTFLLVAAAPLFAGAVDRLAPVLQADTAFFALFGLVYVGVIGMVVWTWRIAHKRSRMLKTKTNKSLIGALRSSDA
ncbi:MAG: hypothetical protein WD993_08555 [Thermoleophilaceae bacterium]